MKAKIIFVPGLGDVKHGGLEKLLKFSLGELEIHFLPLIWSQGEFKPKLAQLLEEIDRLAVGNARISLLGTSAGASAVVNAFVKRRQKIDKVVLVCGKLRENHNYESPRYIRNPAFKESMGQLEKSLASLNGADKKRLLLLYSSGDRTVPPQDAQLAGAQYVKLPSLPHIWAIVYALVFKARSIQKFLK